MGPHSEWLLQTAIFKTGRLKIQSQLRDWPSLVFVLGNRTERRGVSSEKESMLKTPHDRLRGFTHSLSHRGYSPDNSHRDPWKERQLLCLPTESLSMLLKVISRVGALSYEPTGTACGRGAAPRTPPAD